MREAPELLRQAEFVWLGFAVQEEKRAAGVEDPGFTLEEVKQKREQMSMADVVRVHEIARKLRRKFDE